jgi:hypothetical protein
MVLVLITIVAVARVAGRGSVGDPGVGEVVRVGVGDGDSIPEYVASSRAELDRLAGHQTGPVYALVTFGQYLPPDQLAPVLVGVGVVQVHARVPLPNPPDGPDGQREAPQTALVRIPAARVPEDVVAGMDAEAVREDAEAVTDRNRSRSYPGSSDNDRRMREIYESGARVATAEASAYRGHCACVYAAVVRASPEALETVAARQEVRAVDPAPELRRLDRGVFLPPLPEQGGAAGPPGSGPTGVPASASNQIIGPPPASGASGRR